MTELTDLYHPLILQHSRRPENFSKSQETGQTIEAYNPLCGDQFKIQFNVLHNKIIHVSFSGYGCAVSKAATSILLSKFKGLTIPDAMKLLSNYLRSLRGEDSAIAEDLQIFQAVKKYPGRAQCATLSAEAILNYLIMKNKPS